MINDELLIELDKYKNEANYWSNGYRELLGKMQELKAVNEDLENKYTDILEQLKSQLKQSAMYQMDMVDVVERLIEQINGN